MTKSVKLALIALMFAFAAGCSAGTEAGKEEKSYPDAIGKKSESGTSYSK